MFTLVWSFRDVTSARGGGEGGGNGGGGRGGGKRGDEGWNGGLGGGLGGKGIYVCTCIFEHCVHV